jgi:hypothetical protein
MFDGLNQGSTDTTTAMILRNKQMVDVQTGFTAM